VGGAGVAAGVGAPSVCIITRNQTGQYGLSRSTLEEYAAPGDTGDAARDLLVPIRMVDPTGSGFRAVKCPKFFSFCRDS